MFLCSINRIVKTSLHRCRLWVRAGLLDQLRERIRCLHDSLRAEERYVYGVRLLTRVVLGFASQLMALAHGKSGRVGLGGEPCASFVTWPKRVTHTKT